MKILDRQRHDGGSSSVFLDLREDGLVLTEMDMGPSVMAIFGDSDIEYFVSVPVAGFAEMLQLLEVDANVGLDLATLGARLVEEFGADLSMVDRYKAWLTEHGIEFTTFLY